MLATAAPPTLLVLQVARPPLCCMPIPCRGRGGCSGWASTLTPLLPLPLLLAVSALPSILSVRESGRVGHRSTARSPSPHPSWWWGGHGCLDGMGWEELHAAWLEVRTTLPLPLPTVGTIGTIGMDTTMTSVGRGGSEFTGHGKARSGPCYNCRRCCYCCRWRMMPLCVRMREASPLLPPLPRPPLAPVLHIHTTPLLVCRLPRVTVGRICLRVASFPSCVCLWCCTRG